MYDNYLSMQGGDGTFPDPSGSIVGFHALCFYGYDSDRLYLVHSWGDFCGMYGSISKNFFTQARDYIQFFVILDANEVLIARGTYKTVTITSNVPAKVYVNGVLTGDTPYKVPVEIGKKYEILVSAEGYYSNSFTVDESIAQWNCVLEPLPSPSWWERFINWLRGLFKW